MANGESGATDDRLTSEHVGVPNDASGGGSVSDGHVDVLLNESNSTLGENARPSSLFVRRLSPGSSGVQQRQFSGTRSSPANGNDEWP